MDQESTGITDPKSADPAHQEMVRLARSLHRADGTFSLFFVECNAPALRRQLADELAAKLARPPIELDVSPLAAGELQLLDGWIAEQVAGLDGRAALFLFGLEQLLPPSNAERLRQQVQQINWRRSAFARLNRPLVIWLPTFAMNILAEQTPDFYDWHSGIYHVSLQESEQQAMFDSFLNQQTTESGMSAVNQMSLPEKQRWQRTLQELLHEHADDGIQRAKLLVALGYALASQGNYAEALTNYEQALRLFRASGDRAGEGATINNMGINSHARGDYTTALDWLQQSLVIQREIGDRAGEGRTLNNISLIFRARGDYATALDWLQQSLVISREIGDRVGEGTTLNNISLIFSARGDYTTALDYLQQSLVICREIGNRAGLYPALFNIGHIHWQNGEQQAALTRWLESYQIAQELGEAQGLAALTNLGQQLGGNGLEYWEHLKL